MHKDFSRWRGEKKVFLCCVLDSRWILEGNSSNNICKRIDSMARRKDEPWEAYVKLVVRTGIERIMVLCDLHGGTLKNNNIFFVRILCWVEWNKIRYGSLLESTCANGFLEGFTVGNPWQESPLVYISLRAESAHFTQAVSQHWSNGI